MSGSKTVESTAFQGARTQSARKHSIFRSMLTTHRQGTSAAAGADRKNSEAGDKPAQPEGTTGHKGT